MTHRALITGASGFLGGFLAEHLLACGDAVMGTSVDGQWEPTSPPDLRGVVELLTWDVSRDDGLNDEHWQRIAAFQPTCVYHLAGLSVPADCGRDKPTPEALAINVGGTRRVVERIARLPHRPRFLMISTSHVYPPGKVGDPPVDETQRPGPRTPYGRTKLMAEQIVLRAVRAGVLDAVVARAFQQIGPRQNAKMMLSSWASQFAAGRDPIEIYTRDAVVDVLDVRDGARAFRLLINAGRPGEVYNVASGLARRTGHIFDILHRLADPQRKVVETRPGIRQDPVAVVDKIENDTGWHATIPLARTVADSYAWWRSRTP